MRAPLPRTLSVLLVEDSPADGRLLLEALKPAIAAGDLIIQTVKSLALAVDALQGYDFSCVLLDLCLPDGRGIENVRMLREVDRKTAILVLTGIADEKLAAEALTLGAQDYLVKGESDGEQLLKQLRRAAQRNRQTYALETRRDQAFFEASHDALTLLPNAALFADRARIQLASARAQGQSFAIASLQLGGFDAMRRSHGNDIAQNLLLKVAQWLAEDLVPGDTLARIGEQEFALLCSPHTTLPLLATWLLNAQARISNLKQIGDSAIAVSLRVGIGSADDPNASLEMLMNSASQQASVPVSGLEQQSIFNTPQAHGRSSRRPLVLRWQPWVDVGSKRCVGLQLQSAWLSAAHSSDASEPPGSLLLASVDALGVQWRDWSTSYFKPDLLALSLSLEAFEAPGLAGQLLDRLSQCGIPAAHLQLEINEAVFRNLAVHGSALARLRSGGFRLVLAGDGSIETTLREFSAFPLDGYKISANLMGLLMQQGFQGSARRLVSAVCGAAQALGANVIASGVDSEECATALQLIGLRTLQGKALLPWLETEAVPMAWERPVALRS